ncbi:MAG: hypothetical protein EPN20_12660 [Magnetospirillum sp.]|nr:MAG: hypothetical protein EPN20_12660 [Magnetospirillum sp.]
MRKLLIIGGVVLTVIVGGAVYLFSSLDSIVKKIIEDVGTQVAGVKVSVGGVKISLSEGKASISGLSVANPPGFSADPAFKLGEISVTLDTGSLNKNPIVVKDVLVGAPAVSYELGAGGSNLDAIQKNVQAFSAKHAGGKPAEQPVKASDKSEEKKVVIDRLAITGGQVKLAAGGIPGANTTAKLGDIVLKDIGKESGGASATQVAQKVMDSLVNGAIKAATSFGNVLGTVGDKAKALIPGDAGSAVKGLLGK